jgi:pimeloyl-ACP methyl ester carboxylesterase
MEGENEILFEHVALGMNVANKAENQSGLQNLNPRIYGVLAVPKAGSRVGCVLMHPASNFMGHYLIQPLAARGVACLALGSRYMGNDVLLQMEQVIQDLGTGVDFLRKRGYRHIVLIGNSGGAALSAFYQAEAEDLTVTEFVDGGPTSLTADQLPPVDGLILSAAHLGRTQFLLDWIDPAVVDERDLLTSDLSVDMYDGKEVAPYDRAFVDLYRQRQRARRDRIEAWVEERLLKLKRLPSGPKDEPFIIHRTHADLRFLDLTLEPNDRQLGGIWSDPRSVNYSPNAIGRFTSLRSFLSQWSTRSRADGPTSLRRTSVPILHIYHTADASTFESTKNAWMEAAPNRIRNVDLVGANHYLTGQPALVESSADTMAEWIKGICR